MDEVFAIAQRKINGAKKYSYFPITDYLHISTRSLSMVISQWQTNYPAGKILGIMEMNWLVSYMTKMFVKWFWQLLIFTESGT